MSAAIKSILRAPNGLFLSPTNKMLSKIAVISLLCFACIWGFSQLLVEPQGQTSNEKLTNQILTNKNHAHLNSFITLINTGVILTILFSS